jgi:hypothetical protein
MAKIFDYSPRRVQVELKQRSSAIYPLFFTTHFARFIVDFQIKRDEHRACSSRVAGHWLH